MATNRRVARVAEMIRREVSQMLMGDIKDDRVGMGMVSVTDVNVSGDLQHAKIFVSVYGTPEAREAAMDGLRSATGYVRSELGQRVRLRRTPEVIFIEDTSIERGSRILSLLGQIEQHRKEHPIDLEEPLAEADDDVSDDEFDDELDDEDEEFEDDDDLDDDEFENDEFEDDEDDQSGTDAPAAKS
ncbi:MAG TPA: 30S ribosome-binding factor RbfA [Coleofasciculaceae cyanobacterium]